MEVKSVTPAQVWALYLDRVEKDPQAFLELPTIKSLQELEHLDEVELIRLYQLLKSSTTNNITTRATRAREFLDLIGSYKKGVEFYKDKNAKELKKAFDGLGDKRLYRFIFAVKRSRKSLYYILYTSDNIGKYPYRELVDFVETVFNKILTLQRYHMGLTEFAATYRDVVVIAEKFRKDDLTVITKGHELSINELLEKKREKAQKRHKLKRSTYLVEKAISAFFANLFI